MGTEIVVTGNGGTKHNVSKLMQENPKNISKFLTGKCSSQTSKCVINPSVIQIILSYLQGKITQSNEYNRMSPQFQMPIGM